MSATESIIAEHIANWAQELPAQAIPSSVRNTVQRLLLDSSGLCIAAHLTDYVQVVLRSCEDNGQYTLIGHENRLDVFSAALLNGTAAHGEDYDDTFEGTPVHVGAVIVPAALAACEYSARKGIVSGGELLKAIALGGELMCRMALITPTAIHRAGFHPTAVIGALGAALSVSSLLRLDSQKTSWALGLAGSMASGIIEYLAEGTWSKRLHAGWAAQSGLRAALLARAGFIGPRTVLDGQHGFFQAFTNQDQAPDFSHLCEGWGDSWRFEKLAFKPYPCGTMIQPFIDCALRVREHGIRPEAIKAIHCKVGAGTVHRLWEPLAEKRRPSSAYSAKFSVPYGIAVALSDGVAGLEQFEPARVQDERVHKLAERIEYEIDPANEYPRNYSGHIRAELRDGRVVELEQPHLRGGAREPLSDAELNAKFRANAAHGGWTDTQIDHCQEQLRSLMQQENVNDFSFLRG